MPSAFVLMGFMSSAVLSAMYTVTSVGVAGVWAASTTDRTNLSTHSYELYVTQYIAILAISFIFVNDIVYCL